MSSKQNSFEPRQSNSAPGIHPIWRGIGFLMILLTPVMAWATAEVIVEALKLSADKNIKALLYGLRGGISFPKWSYAIPYLSNALRAIGNYPDIKSKILFFFVTLILFSGLLSVLYAIIYRLMGPPRYGPLDVAAPRARAKRYTR